MPFNLKCKFWLGPINTCILDRSNQYFTSLMTSVLYFFMFWTFPPPPPPIMITKPWGTGSVNGDVASKLSCLLCKMSILLILNTYTLHRYLCILQVWRQKHFISNVLGLASLNQDQNSMGYCFNKTGVARKSCFLPKIAMLLRPCS